MNPVSLKNKENGRRAAAHAQAKSSFTFMFEIHFTLGFLDKQSESLVFASF